MYGVASGDVSFSHHPSTLFATSNTPSWQMNHIPTVAIDVGSRSLGILRNALLAMPLKAASWFPAAHCRMGFKAHTYPVTREKIETPIRPCTRTRSIGYWRIRGEASSAEVGLKRSSSNARARWVKTTRTEAIPRRPYDGLDWLNKEGTVLQRRERDTQGPATYIYPFHILLSGTHSAFTKL